MFGNSELLIFNLPFIHPLILSFSEYQFHQIVHMEENNEKEYLQIKRYFVEVDVNKHGSAQLYRYSGWVVINKKNGTETICKPKGYDWDKNEKIYLITPVKNQARWIRFMVHHLNGM